MKSDDYKPKPRTFTPRPYIQKILDEVDRQKAERELHDAPPDAKEGT